jgi:EAL domain-containing protein (putative c-di-GMP-specific phosphodiesterase class I)
MNESNRQPEIVTQSLTTIKLDEIVAGCVSTLRGAVGDQMVLITQVAAVPAASANAKAIEQVLTTLAANSRYMMPDGGCVAVNVRSLDLDVLRPASASELDPETNPAVSRILVADDDRDFRRVVARLLRRAGFEVVEVETGTAAIAELGRQSFDVILSDVHMPNGGGLDLIRDIRRIDLDVPVILMSGVPDVDSAAAAVELGAFRYLTKPLYTDGLEKTVRDAARAHALARLRREAFVLTGSHAGAVDRVGLEVRFEQAIERLWMVYQPIVDARSGAIFGLEALMRSGEVSMPGPEQVLDAATQLGRLPQLGRRVRELTARAIAQRARDVLFVNLHPADLEDPDLVDDVAPLTALAPRVVLEVTERASLASSPELTARLAQLRRLGFRIAVDDIGAGYSGLTSFTELMPEIVKIDMSLVRHVHSNALKQRTIRALCTLCHDSGSLVVAEGVEVEEERECLVALGCDLLQGYLIARPDRELPVTMA